MIQWHQSQIIEIVSPASTSAAATDHSGQIFLGLMCALIILFLVRIAHD